MVKNSKQNTPWGYERIFIKDQGRYVFKANPLVDRYQKNFLSKFGNIKYPTVADCIGPHKGNNYFFVCDIKDAFGGVRKRAAEKAVSMYRYILKGKPEKITDLLFDIDSNVFILKEIKKEVKKLEQEYKKEIIDTFEYSDIYREWGKYISKLYHNDRLDWFVFRYFMNRHNRNYKFENFSDDIKKIQRILKKDNIPLLSDIVEEILSKYKNKEEMEYNIGKKFDLDFLKYYFDIISFLSWEYYTEIYSDKKIEFLREYSLSKYFLEYYLNLCYYHSGDYSKYREIKKDVKKGVKDFFAEGGIPFYRPFLEITDMMIERKMPIKDDRFYSKIFEENPELDNGTFYYDHFKRRLVPNFDYKVKNISLFHGYKGLIQGSRCSPIIFESYMTETVDEKLKEFCKKYDLTYTRYRDDLIFSSSKKTIGKFLRKKIYKILKGYSFKINPKKTKIVNLNKEDLIILGAKIKKRWNIELTKEQEKKKKEWQKRGEQKRVEGIPAWEKYLKKI